MAACALALLCGGCAVGPPRAYAPLGPPVASLPAFEAGIRDGREVFAAHFAAELAASGSDQDVHRWIHFSGTAGRPGAAADTRGVSVLVVPGFLGDCVGDQSLPFGDGSVREPEANLSGAYAYLRSAGFRKVRALPVRGRVRSATNAVVIADAIVQESATADVRKIVVVAYSKGVPDTLEALDRLGATGALAKPVTLVSVAGLVMGTPIADRYEGIYEALATRLQPLRCTPSDGGELASLTYRERIAWLAHHPLPPQVRAYSVVAHTSLERTSPGLQGFYRVLARTDARNDGQVLSADAILPGSTLLAEADSDHWTFLLPLRGHPRLLVRSLAADLPYPRQEFFRALLRTVLELDANPVTGQ